MSVGDLLIFNVTMYFELSLGTICSLLMSSSVTWVSLGVFTCLWVSSPVTGCLVVGKYLLEYLVYEVQKGVVYRIALGQLPHDDWWLDKVPRTKFA